mmetsp:Transcript_48750/g.116041  ORF Transcript_48750/g.116041 Transcript_48750/m.116041 type:complete len:304 (+) Transcript_48750:84-995(+)
MGALDAAAPVAAFVACSAPYITWAAWRVRSFGMAIPSSDSGCPRGDSDGGLSLSTESAREERVRDGSCSEEHDALRVTEERPSLVFGRLPSLVPGRMVARLTPQRLKATLSTSVSMSFVLAAIFSILADMLTQSSTSSKVPRLQVLNSRFSTNRSIPFCLRVRFLGCLLLRNHSWMMSAAISRMFSRHFSLSITCNPEYSCGENSMRLARAAVISDWITIPVKHDITAMNLPRCVCGTMSPYPTVVMVMKVNHHAFHRYMSFTLSNSPPDAETHIAASGIAHSNDSDPGRRHDVISNDLCMYP